LILIRRILGLDPGLRHTGWGVIDINGNQLTHVAHGTISSSSNDLLSSRLVELFQGLKEIIQQYHPTEAAVEETFVNNNPVSTLKLGMARGVVLMTPALFNLSVTEYPANKVKKSVVGVGHATKEQVSHMVQVLLPKATPVKLDAADALAIAICHSHHSFLKQVLS
jgi:crossover junction endodeoxyribonuclease RuvC